MSERRLEQAAAKELEEAGFFVQREATPTASGKRGHAPGVFADVLAWSGDASGELAPEIVVEVAKAQRPRRDALSQLSRIAAVMGARRAFVFDGRWHEADPTFTKLSVGPCPKPTEHAEEPRVPRTLIESEVWTIRNRLRHGDSARGAKSVDAILKDLLKEKAVGRLLRAPRSRLTLARVLSENVDEFGPSADLADALVRLLSPRGAPTVLDPFTRSGDLLWTVAESCPQATLRGWWPNAETVRVANELGRQSGVKAIFKCASFEQLLGETFSVDGVITNPPFNAKLSESVRLSDGRSTADLDLAWLDRLPTWLKPNARAVVVVPPRALFADNAASIRLRLAAEARVVAVVELPHGVLRGTNIPIGILVLEKRPPGGTLVARLGVDWKSQLSESGEFFAAYQRHIAASAT